MMENLMRRILLPASLLIAACSPDIPYTQPTGFVTAVFDPVNSRVPLPNDLVFMADVNSTCPRGNIPAGEAPSCAQAELLASFAGYFPSDQEVPITIDFTETTFGAKGATTQSAPDLDLSTFTPSTFFVYGWTANDQGEIPLEPITAADYVINGDHGTLTLHHKGLEPWPEGTFTVLVRGGDQGVKTKDGKPIEASEVFSLVRQGLDMTARENLGLLKAQLGSTQAAIAQGAQLNQLIALYKDTAFAAAELRFPHQELAITTTFKTQPVVTNVTIDPARGLVPLPIDLLRDPASGKLSALAACTLAGSKLAADGTCPSAAAAGFAQLDGFSTTAAILGPTSDLVQAKTIDPTTLMLFDLGDPANPQQVDPSTLVVEPCEFTSACGSPTALSPVIAIQPGGATSGDKTSVFRARPLKEDTTYAVVMTTGIKDKTGKAIGRGTVAKVLGFQNALSVDGKSALQGIDDTTASSLERMRLELAPVFGKLDPSKVAMAYTFHTQSMLKTSLQLSALPYSSLVPAATALPIASTLQSHSAADAFAKYGVDATVVPKSHIDQILEVDIVTFNLLDPLTGAFFPNPANAAPEVIHVMIATPLATNPKVPACTGGLAPFGKCAPLMVFHHAFQRGRADMLTVADTYAEAGMVTVAIDAAKFGDRSFCTSGTSGAASGCAGGAACTTALPAGAQGDVHPPGTCGTAGFVKHPVSASCTGACAAAATDGIPYDSGNYSISTNVFRTRDTGRQDLIDQSQLIRAIAFVPAGAPPTGHAVLDHMVARGVIIDPATIYYSGQSLGAMSGALVVATNPRITKAALNVGGGPTMDVLASSPFFKPLFEQLLVALGIEEGTADFLKMMVVSKTVADPAEGLNYVGRLTANTLPNLLVDPTGATPQAPKKILMQAAYCDDAVPNAFNFLFASNGRVGPLPTGASFFAPGGTGTFQLFVGSSFDPSTFGACTNGAVGHFFLTDWVTPSLTANAQRDIANFVMTDTNPLRVQRPQVEP
ncbi:MAG TPA: hypothetical protein VLT45_09365 [Kofleriaceae bacterium]|nr:hypothetical protein [Kofleriaceae bacterium]